MEGAPSNKLGGVRRLRVAPAPGCDASGRSSSAGFPVRLVSGRPSVSAHADREAVNAQQVEPQLRRKEQTQGDAGLGGRTASARQARAIRDFSRSGPSGGPAAAVLADSPFAAGLPLREELGDSPVGAAARAEACGSSNGAALSLAPSSRPLGGAVRPGRLWATLSAMRAVHALVGAGRGETRASERTPGGGPARRGRPI